MVVSISITLPNNEGRCKGRYKFLGESKGTWSIACTNGKAASGFMTGFGSGKGSTGEGQDSNGRSVRFTVGGR